MLQSPGARDILLGKVCGDFTFWVDSQVNKWMKTVVWGSATSLQLYLGTKICNMIHIGNKIRPIVSTVIIFKALCINTSSCHGVSRSWNSELNLWGGNARSGEICLLGSPECWRFPLGWHHNLARCMADMASAMGQTGRREYAQVLWYHEWGMAMQDLLAWATRSRKERRKSIGRPCIGWTVESFRWLRSL